MSIPATARRRWDPAGLLAAAFLLHCAEELPRFPARATRHYGTTTPEFYVASHALVLVPAVVVPCHRSSWPAASTGWRYAAVAVAAALAHNAAFHVRTTVAFREYSPGVVSAVLLVFPSAVLTVDGHRRTRPPGDRAATLAALAGGLGLGHLAVVSLRVDMPHLDGWRRRGRGRRLSRRRPERSS